jgi:GNAT superfamily N-acetyltransferase
MSFTFWVLPWKPVVGAFGVLFLVFFTIRAFFRTFEFKRKNDVKPLFVKSINIDKSQRLKGLGSKALKHVEKYALNNGFDIIFGHIPFEAEFTKDDRQTTFTDREMIKYWLHSKGYAVNPENFNPKDVKKYGPKPLTKRQIRKMNMTAPEQPMQATPYKKGGITGRKK